MKKRAIITLLFTLCVGAVCSMLSACGPKPLELTFTKIEGENAYELTRAEDKSLFATSNDKDFVVPSEYKGLPVTRIGAGCFAREEYFDSDMIFLQSVTIPSTITYIGENAFRNQEPCVYAEDLTAWCNVEFENADANPLNSRGFFIDGEEVSNLIIPDGIKQIHAFAFERGRFQSLTIPEGVEVIGESAFQDCAYLSWELALPDSVTQIHNAAFKNCNQIVRVELGAGLQSVGENAFDECFRIAEVVNLSPAISLFAGSEEHGGVAKSALGIYEGEDGREYSNLDHQDGFISYLGGTDKFLVAYVGSENGARAPEGITHIRTRCLEYSAVLKELYLPDSVVEIQALALRGVRTLVIGENLQKVGVQAVPVGADITYRGNIEQWCSIDGVGVLTEQARSPQFPIVFGDAALTGKVVIPKYLTTLPEGVFRNFSLVTEFILPDDVTEIGAYAFEWCTGLTTLELPSTLQKIGAHAFAHCNKIQNELTLPQALTEIGEFAFYDCSSISGRLVIPDGVTEIDSFTFYGCKSLTSLHIGANVQVIYQRAFGECSGLQGTLVIPDLVRKIEYCAFCNCENLSSIVLGAGLTDIYEAIFYECKNVTKIEYNGTRAQFFNIYKHGAWNQGIPVEVIVCKDGNVGIKKIN
jgi:hypothetical protein